jgi:hypothetical protein
MRLFGAVNHQVCPSKPFIFPFEPRFRSFEKRTKVCVFHQTQIEISAFFDS